MQSNQTEAWLLWRVVRVIGGRWMAWGVLFSLRAVVAWWRWWNAAQARREWWVEEEPVYTRPLVIGGDQPTEKAAS